MNQSKQTVKDAGLRFVTDAKPGIRRERRGDEFIYFAPNGSEISDEETLSRIKSLAVPPTYEDVWICPFPNGFLQVTGRDARGRKQYRYHSRWRETRDETKYAHMLAFGDALPAIRARVAADLARPGMPREKVLATVVRLLEPPFIRIGNEEYARENQHYGLTTLRNKHVDMCGGKLHFHFVGKSGKAHEIDVRDSQLARIVKRCRALPGHDLFEYVGDDGQPRTIDSGAVNDYLREISGQNFTAKDFRTWAGTMLCALALHFCDDASSPTQAGRNIVAAIKAVARKLGNTPAVCRKSYVYPAVLERYRDGTMTDALTREVKSELREKADDDLRPEEAALMNLLQSVEHATGA